MSPGKKFLASVLAVGALSHAMCGGALAWEPGYAVGTFPGITIGIPAGVNPPPGVYFINYGSYGSSNIKGSGSAFGLPSGTHADIALEAPQIVWSTPWMVFGGTLSMSVIQPTANINVRNNGTTLSSFSGLHNFVLNPANVSWNLGGGFFGSVGIEITPPTGTIGSSPFGNDLGNVGAPYWTFEPKAALSYLGDGYNLTALMRYGINTENRVSKITNGNYLNLELTATKKFSKWELGPVAYLSAQTTDDRNCPPISGWCSHGSTAALGALVGYDFGPFSAKLIATNEVVTTNYSNGWRVWTQLQIPLWMDAPPPKPVTAKF